MRVNILIVQVKKLVSFDRSYSGLQNGTEFVKIFKIPIFTMRLELLFYDDVIVRPQRY